MQVGLKTFFNKELVKSGKLTLNQGKVYNHLFTLRQEADYEDFFVADEKEIEELFPKVESLLSAISLIIEEEFQK